MNCSTERIALVERTSRLEERARVVAASQQRALAARQQAEGWHLPVLESLDFQVQWAHEVRQQYQHDPTNGANEVAL